MIRALLGGAYCGEKRCEIICVYIVGTIVDITVHLVQNISEIGVKLREKKLSIDT